MTELTREQFEAAKARGEARLQGPRAVSAHYDAGRNRVIVRLTTGVELGFAPGEVEGLQLASAGDLKAIEVEAFGLGIHFPKLDVDLYVPALLEGVLGSKRWMTARLGTADKETRSVSDNESANRLSRPSVTKSRLADTTTVPPSATVIIENVSKRAA